MTTYRPCRQLRHSVTHDQVSGSSSSPAPYRSSSSPGISSAPKPAASRQMRLVPCWSPCSACLMRPASAQSNRSDSPSPASISAAIAGSTSSSGLSDHLGMSSGSFGHPVSSMAKANWLTATGVCYRRARDWTSRSRPALEERSEPHHQPRAHRRGLSAQTHNLLWVRAARHILVAWKAPHLARTNAVRMAVEATERTRQGRSPLPRSSPTTPRPSASTSSMGRPERTRPSRRAPARPLSSRLSRAAYPIAPRRSLGRRPSAVSSAPRRRSQRIRPTAGPLGGRRRENHSPRQHRNTP